MNDLPKDAHPTRGFLSYARGDDEPFVRRLHTDLTNAGFTVWFDRESLISRGLTFHQEIKDAIRTEVDRVVYVGGPKAAMSAFVREEWQFALECEHVVVTPILRLGDYENVPGELSLLHCEDFRDDVHYPAALAKLIASLRQPNPKLGALFAVPNLPQNFLGRPDLMRRVRNALLVDLQKPQVITEANARVGMQGMGGIGKSVLAAALARNRQVRQAYPDGVVWIACGQKLSEDDLLNRQRDLARHLGGDNTFSSQAQGQGVLRQLLSDKAVMVVLDDVWRAADARPFDVLGPRYRMLVTTRDKGILDALHGELVPVSLFTELEALHLLADAVNVAPAALPAEAREVARECGLLPLALALCGRMARKRGGDFHSVLERLRRADLEKIDDRESINEQHRSIWRAMQASVEMLPDDEQQRFAELSVFATDQTVPEAAAATLWSHTGDLDDLDTEELLINLAERSLVQLDQKTEADGKVRRRFRLHDLLHDYAVRVAGEPRAVHQKLLDAYRKKCLDEKVAQASPPAGSSGVPPPVLPEGWAAGPNDGYFFENLVHHLAENGVWTETEAVVTDFSWLMRKCELGLLDSISGDYGFLDGLALAEMKKRLEIWNAFFREKAHILRRGNEEWPAHKILLQLAMEHADDSPLTIGAEQWLAEGRCDWLWLRRVPRLPHAQAIPCLVVLEGHSRFVNGALALSDDRLLSWSDDRMLRLWDSKNGACLALLEGHTDGVRGALALSDGRLLSWSGDNTLRLWDGQSGACLALLEGHTEGVRGALALSDGRILSWSMDYTLRLWDGQSGACLAVLRGHTIYVTAALELGDGRLLSWAEDGTLRLWNGWSGACLAVLRGHTHIVNGALVLADQRLLSWSEDKTMRLWHWQKGERLAALEGHTREVNGALALSDGRLLSWSMDKTLRLWNGQNGACLKVLEGHTAWINGVLALAGERLLSWSADRTLRLWDAKSGVCLAVIKEDARGALVLSDGRLLSWSMDDMLRIWDVRSESCLAEDERHTDKIMGSLALADDRLLSWSFDSTLRLWSRKTGACLAALRGHRQWVKGALMLRDGRFMSCSGDKTIRLWEGQCGTCLAVLEGHTDEIRGVCELGDGRLLSLSDDKTIRLWDGQTGECLAVIKGHTDKICGALALVEERLLSWSVDKTLRLWDSQSGASLAVLKGHTDEICGALALAEERLLSWSVDKTLRLWDGQSGACLAVLKGHTDEICGALVLNDKRLLSWSRDSTLRLWDGYSGAALAVLEGHNDWVDGALALNDGLLLSWSRDGTYRLWNGQSGACLEVLPEEQIVRRQHDRLLSQAAAQVFLSLYPDLFLAAAARTVYLRHRVFTSPLASWNAESRATPQCLFKDGMVVVAQENGQVCFLKLYHGDRFVSLADAEAILLSQRKNGECHVPSP